jgi:Na+/melibiose symporter-like transporter
MSLGLILVIILIILLLGGFSGRFGGYGYGYGHRGIGVVGIILIVLLVLLLMHRIWARGAWQGTLGPPAETDAETNRPSWVFPDPKLREERG